MIKRLPNRNISTQFWVGGARTELRKIHGSPVTFFDMNFDDILSGRRKDLIAIATRMVFTPAAWVYGAVVTKRNRDFDHMRKTIRKVSVPVVCIGNLTTGGTGKTPIVCHFAQWLRDQGVRVSIISRGYRSDESGTNDEAKELAIRLPDVPHVQNPERFEAAEIAVEELATELILMDDGFQHRRFHRDLDFVAIDVTCPFGFGRLLPRGLLREPVSELRRADAVIVTRCDAVSTSDVDEIVNRIAERVKPGTPILRTCHEASGVLFFPDRVQPIEVLSGMNVVCLSAIGNPAAFERTTEGQGANVIDHYRLPDHADFDRDTMKNVLAWIDGLGESIDAIVCTHKDLVKIQAEQLSGRPIMAIQIDLCWIDEPECLYEMIAAMSESKPIPSE